MLDVQIAVVKTNKYATRESVTDLPPPEPVELAAGASVLAHAARARVDTSPAATRAAARRVGLNPMSMPFSIEKLLLVDYKGFPVEG